MPIVLTEGEVHLWCVAWSALDDPTLLARYRDLLTDEERTAHGRFYFEEGRREYLMTRALVRDVLSRYAPEIEPAAWRFVRSKYGRPSVAPELGTFDFRFNLSNTKGLVVCAISRDEIGADVEAISRGEKVLPIAETVFSDEELRTLRALPKAANGKPMPAAIVLMSDGSPTIGRGGESPAVAVDDEATTAKQTGVPIDTIAFGTAEGTVTIRGQTVSVPSDPVAMARIAHESGGKSFTAKSASQLHTVYDQIGRAVGYVVHHHEVTSWFTGLGLALGALAGAAALIWSSRLV